jgi:hypothetical protein
MKAGSLVRSLQEPTVCEHLQRKKRDGVQVQAALDVSTDRGEVLIGSLTDCNLTSVEEEARWSAGAGSVGC